MPGARMRRRKKLRDERAVQGEGGQQEEEDVSNQLFGDDDNGDDLEIKVNQKFKERFEHNEKLKDKMRLKELEREVESEHSSDTEEDDEADLLTEEMDMAIMDTIARIKKKDPRIYDVKAKFFEDAKSDEDEEGGEGGEKKKEKKVKKFTVTDMARELILKGKTGANSDEDEDEDEDEEELGYYEEQANLKKMFGKDGKSKATKGDADGSDDDEDLFVPRKRTAEEKKKEDKEFELFSRDRLAEKNPTQTLASLLKDENLDQDELWLRQYILGNEWKKEDEEHPSYGQIVGQVSDEEEDEDHIKLQEDFEEVYNHRYEQQGSAQIVGHSRSIEGSVRREESKRKEKRMAKASRAEQEMQQKREELKRLKNLKKLEIYERLKKIQELSKAKDVGTDKIDLEADFDPAEHDRKMAALYDEEYYGEEEAEHPFANEADEEFLAQIGYEDGEWGEEEEYEEEEEEKAKGRKMSKKEERQAARDAARAEKKRGKHVSEAEMESVAKATGMDKYLEEYYQLDFEGMAGDVPTRFKYRETEAVDVGLTAEEILLLDDKELRQCMPISYFGAPFKGNIPPKVLKKLKTKARAARRQLYGDEGEGEGEGGAKKKDKKKKRQRDEEEEEDGEGEQEEVECEGEDGEGEEKEEKEGGKKKKKKSGVGGGKRDKWGNKISGAGGSGGGDKKSGGRGSSGGGDKNGGGGAKRDKWGNKIPGGRGGDRRGSSEGGGKFGGGDKKRDRGGNRGEAPGWKKAGMEQDRFESYGLGNKSEKKELERDKKKHKYDQAHKAHSGEGRHQRERPAFKGDGDSGGGWQKVTKFDDE